MVRDGVVLPCRLPFRQAHFSWRAPRATLQEVVGTLVFKVRGLCAEYNLPPCKNRAGVNREPADLNFGGLLYQFIFQLESADGRYGEVWPARGAGGWSYSVALICSINEWGGRHGPSALGLRADSPCARLTVGPWSGGKSPRLRIR